MGMALILTQCVSSQPTTTSSPPANGRVARTTAEHGLENGCPLDKLTWLVVSKEYSDGDLAALAGRLSEAARNDAEKLKEMTARGESTPLEMSSNLKDLVEATSQTKMQVDDSFYKEYINNRMAICSILDALRKGSIKKDESVKATESAFRKVAESFDELSVTHKNKAAKKINK
jgi:hypothetical protein